MGDGHVEIDYSRLRVKIGWRRETCMHARTGMETTGNRCLDCGAFLPWSEQAWRRPPEFNKP